MLEVVTLPIVGTAKRMCTAPGLDPISVCDGALSETPIILAYQAGRITKIFDETQLRELYGVHWPKAKAIIESLRLHDLDRALTASTAAKLTEQGRTLLAEIEAVVLERLVSEDESVDRFAVIAALSLIVLQARLSAILIVTDCDPKSRPAR